APGNEPGAGRCPARLRTRGVGGRRPALRDGVVSAGEFETVIATLRDQSFTFVDTLSVAAWGHGPGAGHSRH
ncbi:MAG TPA: hypothetical protein VKG61_06815, partial [Streptosporangiaceae bacterium]|nr:hypothetical protein [Streptosporangiaceae bacterium]